ncbi:MAG: hypothetical protein RR387_04235 [Clostridiales bacterium]
MFRNYMIRLTLRILIFLSILYCYFFHYTWMESIMDFKLLGKLTPLHLLWTVLMFGMLLHLFPQSKITMSGRKQLARTYQAPEEPYEEQELLHYVKRMNVAARQVMLGWLLLNLIFGVLYLYGIIGVAELFLLTMFFFISDLICILLFCPFQTFFMKNRCCVNCRIFDWGHFMMYTPMLFIKSFFSWSLFFTACIVLIRWELSYAKHPERFWEGSNLTIRCENCHDQICKLKKPLANLLCARHQDN